MRFTLAGLLVALTAALQAGNVAAQPQIPATYFGSVTVDGKPAEAGLEVRAFVGGLDCTQSPPGQRAIIRDGEIAAYVAHVVHESQRAGCARDGATVTFTIGGRSAVQSGTWKPGPIRLDLSVGSVAPIPLPSATGTLAAAISAAAATTPQPGSITPGPRPTGTPPTHDVQFPGTNSSRTPDSSVFAPTDSEGGSSLFVAGVVALGMLGIAGGAAGILLSRRWSKSRTRGPEA